MSESNGSHTYIIPEECKVNFSLLESIRTSTFGYYFYKIIDGYLAKNYCKIALVNCDDDNEKEIIKKSISEIDKRLKSFRYSLYELKEMALSLCIKRSIEKFSFSPTERLSYFIKIAKEAHLEVNQVLFLAFIENMISPNSKYRESDYFNVIERAMSIINTKSKNEMPKWLEFDNWEKVISGWKNEKRYFMEL